MVVRNGGWCSPTAAWPARRRSRAAVRAPRVRSRSARSASSTPTPTTSTSYPDPSGSSAATQQRFESNPLWGTLIGQIHTAPDTTWMSAVGIQGAQSILDDLAATFGVDPARS